MLVKPIYDTLVCFGDSLTQQASFEGFVGELQSAYQRRLEVVSRGFSGYTSRQALALCPKLFLHNEQQQEASKEEGTGTTRLATIWLGTNDAIKPGFAQHVPIDEFADNMEQIIRQYFDQVDVVLITPTTVVPQMFQGHEDDALHVQYGQRLAALADRINKEREQANNAHRVALVDMRQAFLQAVSSKEVNNLADLFQQDGLHISPRGYRVVFESIMATIQQHFPQLVPGKIPFLFPAWTDLNLAADGQGQSQQLVPKYARV